MIEIIEKPQHKCELCGCVFSFDKEDIHSLSLKEGEVDVFSKFVSCPICGLAFMFFENEL